MTQRLALAAARHPWRTVAVWGAAVVVSIRLIAAFLGDALSGEAEQLNNPESTQASDLIAERAPPTNVSITDVVLVRSDSLMPGDAAFRRKVDEVTDLVMFQQMGFGVAVSLLLDATIIRSVILPATMKLLGKWNWYLPRRLEWLPDFHVEGAR